MYRQKTRSEAKAASLPAGIVILFYILLTILAVLAYSSSTRAETAMKPLTPEETHVIRNKGTEAPFSGAYWNTRTAGSYLCRQCGAKLYESGQKFDSGCGWPSFDDAVPGAVKRIPDADGRRTEIICASCGGHLGHVFEGEGLTPKNTRHCVNSLSMLFVPVEAAASEASVSAAEPAVVPGAKAEAYFAGGCFWGVEDAFSKVDGVHEVISGYMGGKTPNPTYESVSSGRTGHAETVRVVYDPSKVNYETLAKLFFEIHDPGQLNRQGPDKGTQYRSAVFYADDAQKATAMKLMDQLRANGWEVVTTLEPVAAFTPAEDYHQDFTARTGRGGCHLRVARFDKTNR